MKISCSTTNKWFNCTLSPYLEEQAVDLKGNDDSMHFGILVHEYVEYKLKSILKRGAEERKNKYFPPVTKEFCEYYINYIDELSNNFTDKILIEHKINLSNFAQGLFGRIDCVIISDHDNLIDVHVIDLKTGNLPVSAKDNPQLLCYLLGLYEEYKKSNKHVQFYGHIVQPAIKRNSVFKVDEKYLDDFGKFLSNRYNDIIENPIAIAGEHCSKSYCSARFICKTYKEYLDHKLFKIDTNLEYEKLSEDEMRKILDYGREYITWLDGAMSTIKAKMVDDQLRLSGYQIKSIKKRSYIENKAKIIEKFIELGLPEEVYMNYKIAPITQIEKHLTKEQMLALSEIIEEKEYMFKITKAKGVEEDDQTRN